jgi:hypothetical protein
VLVDRAAIDGHPMNCPGFLGFEQARGVRLPRSGVGRTNPQHHPCKGLNRMNRTTSHRITPCPLALALVAATLSAGTSARADVVSSWWGSTQQYDYEVIHMPDLDQRREDAPGVVGLPGDGGMYCVPTSVVNLFAYAANHGFEQISPGPGWWQLQSRYNDAGDAIALLGALMGTSPIDGTNGSGTIAGTYTWLFVHGNVLSSNYQYANGAYSPTINGLAWSAINGGIVAFAYGRYNVIEAGEDTVLVGSRASGHMVTLARAERSFNSMVIASRDPADDPDSDQWDFKRTQSLFGNNVYDARNVTVIHGDPFWVRTMTALNWDPNDHDGKIRLIDGSLTIKPRYGLTFINTGGPESYFQFIFAGGWFSPPPQVQFQWGQLHAPIDALLGQDDDEFLVIAEGAIGQPNVLQRYDLDTQEVTDIVPIPNASRLVLGRKRQLYILAGDRLHCVDPDVEEPELITVPLPFEINALAFDDRTDRLIGLSTLERVVINYEEHLQGEPIVQPLPPEVELSGDGSVAVSPVDGRLWMVSEENDLVYGVMFDVDGEPPLVIVNNDQIQNPTDVSVGDDNHVLVTTDGRIIELEKISDTAWRPVQDSVYANMEVGRKFQIARSRTNFDPEVHTFPEWGNVDPDELAEIGTYIADCAGDMNGDQVIDVFDLLYLLGVWGEDDPLADIAPLGTGDDIVNVFDLPELLSAWGNCP